MPDSRPLWRAGSCGQSVNIKKRGISRRRIYPANFARGEKTGRASPAIPEGAFSERSGFISGSWGVEEQRSPSQKQGKKNLVLQRIRPVHCGVDRPEQFVVKRAAGGRRTGLRNPRRRPSSGWTRSGRWLMGLVDRDDCDVVISRDLSFLAGMVERRSEPATHKPNAQNKLGRCDGRRRQKGPE